MNQPPHILVTGATGYVGGRLIKRLWEAGYPLRAMGRSLRRLQGRRWSDQVELAAGDVLKPETLTAPLAGIDVAYYLIHSMGAGHHFLQRDLDAARNFGQAAQAAGVQRIIYLSGLGDPDADLSEHLRSRQLTGDALRASGVPVTEFRAAVIVGSGSLSFEMIRYLTERVPVMICPRWVYTRVQPIGIRNVVDYLVAALAAPASAGQVIEIGGADVLTYGEMMLGYARARGLRRWLVPVPALTPRLSSYWVHLVTPIPANIARPLIDGLRNEVVVRDDRARTLFPDIAPLDYLTAVQRALRRLDANAVETVWSEALSSSQGDTPPVILEQEQGMLIEFRQRLVAAPPEVVFRVFSGVGGRRGWFRYNWLWAIRGVLDRLVGGVGMRRGRRHPDELRVGDALDFWRVEAVEPDRLIRLRAEMKLPGEGWLQYKAIPRDDGHTQLEQTAFFAPKGLFGFLYWYAVYVIHRLVFSDMIEQIARRAAATAATGEPDGGNA